MSHAHATDPVEEGFVRAVAAGTLREAEGLLAQYSAKAMQRLAGLPPHEQEELLQHVAGVLRWAISMARTERAQACTRLLELPPASSYRGGRSKPGVRLRLEA